MRRWYLRRNRWIRLAMTVGALAFQLPVTVLEIPRLGTERYLDECRKGIRFAVGEALA